MMHQHVHVGLKTKSKGYTDVKQIPANQLFHYRRKGFELLPSKDVEELRAKMADKAAKKTAKKASKKTAKKASKKTAKNAAEKKDKA